MEASDAALVTALGAGDPRAFDLLYARHHSRIWAFVARLARDRAEAEDLFQETWLAVARHASRLEPQTELVPWLFTIARNKHRSAWRFRLFDRRKKDRLATEPLRLVPTPESEAAWRRDGEAVERALATLADAHREVLILATVEGLDTAAVATVLGLREDAVRKRLSRARAALAEVLRAPGVGDGDARTMTRTMKKGVR